MRTTLDLNKRLLDEVVALTKEKSKGRAVNTALAEYVRRRKLEELLAARGTFDLIDNLKELEEAEIEEMKRWG